MKSVPGFVLALIGGILGLLVGLVLMLFASIFAFIDIVGGGFSFGGVFFGFVLLVGAVLAFIGGSMMLNENKIKTGSIICIAVGVISINIFTFFGGLIGFLAWKKENPSAGVSKPINKPVSIESKMKVKVSPSKVVSKNVSADDSKTYALLGVLFTIVGFILVKISRPNDEYAMFYARQGLVLGLGYVCASFFLMLLLIPFIGGLIMGVIYLGLTALWIMGMVYAMSGEEKDIPLVGVIARKINL